MFVTALSSCTSLSACDRIFLRTEIQRLSSGRTASLLKKSLMARCCPHASCPRLQKLTRSWEIVSASSLSSPGCVSSPLAHPCNCFKAISWLLSWFLVKGVIPDLIPTNPGQKGGCKSSTVNVPAFSTSSLNDSSVVKQWAKCFLPVSFKAVAQMQSLSRPFFVLVHVVP